MKTLIRSVLSNFGINIVRAHKKSKKTNEISLHETATGKFWLPKHAYSDCIANAIKEGRIFEEPVYEIAKKYIKPNTTVLDIGSNFGQMAILMSKLVGENGVVHAFEADDFVYSILEKNCRINGDNIISHFGAVHNKSGETLYFPEQDFERFDAYGSYGIDYAHGKGRPVKTLTIDDFQFEKPVSFIKIDVQGGDLLAMQGAQKTIEKYHCPILFEYEYAFEEELKLSFQEYVDFVQSINYKFEKVVMGHNYLIIPK